MLNTCVKAMEKLGTYTGTICVRLTTVLQRNSLNHTSLFINRRLVPSLAHLLPTTISTGNLVKLPLVEQMFYPFSTESIISTTNLKN